MMDLDSKQHAALWLSLIITAQWVKVMVDLPAQSLPIKDEQGRSPPVILIVFHLLNFNVR